MNVNEFLTITQSSKILGVFPQTLRYWSKVGKIKVYRHPINNFRLYDPKDVEEIRAKLNNE